MLQPDLVSRMRLMAENTRVPEQTLSDRVQQVESLRPGERVQARVERELSRGRFHVSVNGRSFDMNLPPGARVGDQLRLTFLGDQPRPTFFLLNERAGTEGDRLSQVGRLISALVRRPPGEHGQPLLDASVLLPEGPSDASRSAPRLRDALSQSGLFYESHQAQWVAGHRSLEQLRREPQARLGAGDRARLDEKPGASQAITIADDAPQIAELRGGPVHPDTFALVRLQLEALEARHAPWQGEIWPGQWLEWQTGQSEEERDADRQPAWYTSLALEMPSLGALRVRAVLAAEGVRLTLNCADEAVARRLRDAGAELDNGLRARGLALAALNITLPQSPLAPDNDD